MTRTVVGYCLRLSERQRSALTVAAAIRLQCTLGPGLHSAEPYPSRRVIASSESRPRTSPPARACGQAAALLCCRAQQTFLPGFALSENVARSGPAVSACGQAAAVPGGMAHSRCTEAPGAKPSP